MYIYPTVKENRGVHIATMDRVKWSFTDEHRNSIVELYIHYEGL